MGLITKKIEVTLVGKSKKYYEEKGYDIPKRIDHEGKFYVPNNSKIIVKTKDLPNGSGLKVEVICDKDDCNNKIIKKIPWREYFETVNKFGKYYCHSCIMKTVVKEKAKETRLNKSTSFKQWCVNNDKNYLLDLWDYELNECNPDKINYRTGRKYWFKCPKGVHKSELKTIGTATKDVDAVEIVCNQCNSFGQYLISTYGENSLSMYWSDKNIINPLEIAKNSNTKIWLKCSDTDYHEDYEIQPSHFVLGGRCPYCASKKIHPKDSLGQYIVDNYGEEFLNKIWSDKNDKTAFEYSPKSEKKVWLRCLGGNHKDHERKIDCAFKAMFKCPSCSKTSGGESRISRYLNKYDIEYIPQKSYSDLVGVNNRILLFDFYIEKCNLLIEYQGEQHEKPIKHFGGYKKFVSQQEHDVKKKQYCIDNNINLLEIWYWDFDNIESILTKTLSEIENGTYINTYAPSTNPSLSQSKESVVI